MGGGQKGVDLYPWWTLMDKQRWEEKQFKAISSDNIAVETHFLSIDYDPPVISGKVLASDTGLLELLRLEPKRGDLPSFSARWDQAADSIDVDMHGDADEEPKFAAQARGYRGHKTTPVCKSPRMQEINIETPKLGLVFKGTVSLNIRFARKISRKLNPHGSLTARVSPSAPLDVEGMIFALACLVTIWIVATNGC